MSYVQKTPTTAVSAGMTSQASDARRRTINQEKKNASPQSAYRLYLEGGRVYSQGHAVFGS